MSDIDHEALVLRYLDGEVSDDEVATLVQQLRDDAPTRQRFVQISQMHLLVRRVARDQRLAVRLSRTRWLVAVATAAAVLLCAVWLGMPSPPDTLPTIASLRGTVGIERDGQRHAAVIGERLAVDDRLVVGGDGGLALVWADGAHVAVDPDSNLTVPPTTGARLRLERGTLLASVVAHAAEAPFAIATPDGLVTDIGTVFAVHRRADGTRVDVRSGSVRLDAAGSTVLVPAGRSGAIAAGGPATLLARPDTSPLLALTAAHWAEAMPIPDTMIEMPPGLDRPWQVKPVASATLILPPNTASAPIVDRRHLGSILAEVPVPALSSHAQAIASLDALVLADPATDAAWRVTKPSLNVDGRLFAEEVGRIAISEAFALPPLAGILTAYDLEHPGHHALAIALPADVLKAASLDRGDRLGLVRGLRGPGGATVEAVMHQGLINMLTSHGARIVGNADQPTLYIDSGMPEAWHPTLTETLRTIAPYLRRVARNPSR